MISVTVDTKDLGRMQRFIGGMRNQLPYATSLALNQTAWDVQQALGRETTRAFVAPTQFTQRAFRYEKSTKANLTALIFPAPDRPYFDPQIFGGSRRWKDYEGFIRGLASSRGKPLPPGKLAPTARAIDAAGNPKKSLFGQIESKLSSTDQGGFFIGTPKGSTTAGVWRRSRGQLYPYFIVISEPQYERRFPFEEVCDQTVARVFPSHLSAAVDRALAPAR